MNRVQEMIDERMDEMPVGLAKDLLEACRDEAQARPQLYKLTWTTVDSHAHVEHCEDEEDFADVTLKAATQTLIVEAVDKLPSRMTACVLPHHGMMLKSWLKLQMPQVCTMGEDSLRIIHSIVPYESCKRARDAELA